MKITTSEIRYVEDLVQQAIDHEPDDCGMESLTPLFSERPHLLFPIGYDEYTAFKDAHDFASAWLGVRRPPAFE